MRPAARCARCRRGGRPSAERSRLGRSAASATLGSAQLAAQAWPAGQLARRGGASPVSPIHQVCSFCTNYLLQRQHLRREDRCSDSNPVSLVQIRLVPALRPVQAPHFDASADLLAAVLVAVPSTPDLSAPV